MPHIRALTIKPAPIHTHPYHTKLTNPTLGSSKYLNLFLSLSLFPIFFCFFPPPSFLPSGQMVVLVSALLAFSSFPLWHFGSFRPYLLHFFYLLHPNLLKRVVKVGLLSWVLMHYSAFLLLLPHALLLDSAKQCIIDHHFLILSALIASTPQLRSLLFRPFWRYHCAYSTTGVDRSLVRAGAPVSTVGKKLRPQPILPRFN